ncbi:MAG: PDZ domain-containing protein [Planctomycetota bacterium]
MHLRLVLASLGWLICSSSLPLFAEDEIPTLADRLPDEWRQTARWRSIGPSVMGGRITAITVFEGDTSRFWVASASGGLLATQSNGVRFEHQFDHEAVVSIGDVQVAPSDPEIVWVGTGEANPRNSVSWGNGVFRSTDGGESWEHRGLEGTFQIGRIAVHPTDPNVVYVGALGRLWGPNEERGLYKTVDGGETWEKILYIDENTGVVDVQMNPADPETLIVATYERRRSGFDVNEPVVRYSETSGLYRTRDGGQTFERLTQGLPTVKLGRIGIDYFRSRPDIVYAIVESEKTGQRPRKVAFAGFILRDREGVVEVTRVSKGGPAEKAGLQSGDQILAVEGREVSTAAELREIEREREPGTAMILRIARGGRQQAKRLILEEAAFDFGRLFRTQSFSSGLNGQSADVQDDQQPDGFQHGGVYRSDDGGTSWRRVNSLNPRPMYFSQIRVDPSDDQRVYVCGISLWASSDGGQSFSSNMFSDVHPDHHALWIDPSDGRHMILGNDGGLYVTWDRGRHWDHHNHFAIGQFYHVAVGPDRDYWVYGGLQDNGTWGAPHRVAGRGTLNQDWFRIGSGDGFVVRVDSTDPSVVYYESQNGFTGRLDRDTGQRQGIRPRRSAGERPRFNWKTPFILSSHNASIYYSAGHRVFRSVDRGERLSPVSPEITRTNEGSATALAESHFDPGVLWVGTDDGALHARHDEGATWIDLAKWDEEAPSRGDLWSEVVLVPEEVLRRQKADSKEASATDPWAGRFEGTLGESESCEIEITRPEKDYEIRVTTIEGEWTSEAARLDEESGRLEASLTSSEGSAVLSLKRNGDELRGQLTSRSTGEVEDIRARRKVTEIEDGSEQDGQARPLRDLLPGPRWVSSLEASRHARRRVYACFDGHRSDDDAPYVFVSEDLGLTWRSLRSNLPEVTTRVLREDIENPNVLYLGTELGAWVSADRGESWMPLGSELPTVAVHELAQHPLSEEIVAGTHGRSLWVLDVSMVRQLGADVIEKDVHLFEPADIVVWENGLERGSEGQRQFAGSNPDGLLGLYYWLGQDVEEVMVTVEGVGGKTLLRSNGPVDRGVHRIDWNVQLALRPNRERNALGVEPGRYAVTLKVGEHTESKTFRVLPDPSR